MSTGINVSALSEKQLDYVTGSDAFVNIADGSIRAGKTASGLLRWLKHVREAPVNGELVVCAKTYDTAVRNIFNPLRDPVLFGKLANATTYTRGAPTAKILGRTIEVVTFNDERAEGRLRGMTCAGGYVDEWSLMPESFHEQLVGRCSLDEAKLFGNTNPDNPRHWLKINHLDEIGPGKRHEGDWKRWLFGIDDNPALSEKVKARYRRQYVGLWYRRMILGEWCLAEGAVYEVWDHDRHVVSTLPDIVEYVAVGIDYGTTNPFAALLLGVGTDGVLYITNEWRWDSKKRQRSLTESEYSAYVRDWLDDLGIKPQWFVVDKSAASFRTQLFRDNVLATASDSDVMAGIRMVATLLSEDRLRVHESCTGVINEFPGYTWDDKKVEKGEDAPIKLDDHSLDALRYAVYTSQQLWRPLVRQAKKHERVRNGLPGDSE